MVMKYAWRVFEYLTNFETLLSTNRLSPQPSHCSITTSHLTYKETDICSMACTIIRTSP